MDELLIVVHTTQLVKLFFQEILHRLHIMVRHALNVLNALRVGFGKVTVNVSQGFENTLIHPFQLRQRQLTQRDKVFYFNLYTVFNQCKF